MNVLDSKAPFIMGSLLSDNFPTQISRFDALGDRIFIYHFDNDFTCDFINL